MSNRLIDTGERFYKGVTMERKTVLDADIEKVLISAKELDALTDKIAGEIDRDYRDSGKRLLLLCILKGIS